jgi:hypothetical protein
MMLSDVIEVKKVCDINLDDHSEDSKLNFFIEQASDWILEYLDRHDIEKKERTQYYNGSGTLQLQLRYRPVFTTGLRVWVSSNGFFGQTSGAFDPSTELIFGTGFALKIDQDDGTSRSGLLIRMDGNYWPKRAVRTRGLLASFLGPSFGSIKVTSTAGYTIDTIPSQLRSACNLLVTRMRYLWPLGMEIQNESYEERSIGFFVRNKNYLMSAVLPMIHSYKNWSF